MYLISLSIAKLIILVLAGLQASISALKYVIADIVQVKNGNSGSLLQSANAD